MLNEPKFTIEDNVLKGEVRPIPCSYTSVGRFLFDQLTKNEAIVSQVDALTGKEETFGQLLSRSIRCALWMRKQGVEPGDTILLSTHNHLDCVVPLCAAFLNGVALSCLSDTLQTREFQYTMSVVKPKLAFVSEKCAEVVVEAANGINLPVEVIVFGNIPGIDTFSRILEQQTSDEVENFRCAEITDPKHTAWLLFTSGTTGLPKAVMISHSAILKQLVIYKWETSNRSTLMYTPLHWITGMYSATVSLIFGTKRIVVPYFKEELIGSAIERFKIQWLAIGASVIKILLKSDIWTRYDFSSLGMILIGGGVMKKESLEKISKYLPRARIVHMYGVTELGGIVAIQSKSSKVGSCGRVLPNVELKVIDNKTGKVLGPNSAGELYIKSFSAMTGYYENPKATEETVDSEGYVRSGDLGFYDEDGDLFILDRVNEFIDHKGYHVSPSEMESVIMEHPGVKEVAVVALPHPVDTERPMAFVTKVPGVDVTEQELMDLVAKQLSVYKQLTGGVKFLDEMPLTSTGKIKRKELKELAKSFQVSS